MLCTIWCSFFNLAFKYFWLPQALVIIYIILLYSRSSVPFNAVILSLILFSSFAATRWLLFSFVTHAVDVLLKQAWIVISFLYYTWFSGLYLSCINFLKFTPSKPTSLKSLLFLRSFLWKPANENLRYIIHGLFSKSTVASKETLSLLNNSFLL